MTTLSDIKVSYSLGQGKGGRHHAYVRPAKECFNRSRRVGGWVGADLAENIQKCVAKWYTPLTFYRIDGCVIGSNSEVNALREFWRVCDRKDIGRLFPVEIIKD